MSAASTDRAQLLEELPRRPRGLQGVLRRAIPLSRHEARLRRRLAESARAVRERVDQKLRTSGALAEIARAAERWRALQNGGGEKARLPHQPGRAVGRGGMPLDEKHARELMRIFRTDSMQFFGQLLEGDFAQWGLDVEALLADEFGALYTAGGRGAQAKLGIRPNFSLRNPGILEALAERANMLAGDFSDEMFDRLRTVVAEEFFLAGSHPFEVAEELQQEFSFFSKARARRIARTETLVVTEEAQWQLYKASGVELRRWLTTLDGRERFAHFKAHGQIRTIDDPFDLEDEQGRRYQLLHPGDPDGDPSMIIQCRCDTMPIVSASQLFTADRVWQGDLDPDEFSRERLRREAA